MADFQSAVAFTLKQEGGLVDNPADPGGLTNYGIALNEHPELTAADIRAMTPARAAGIYRAEYWPDLYDQIQSQALALQLFDFGVTSGVRQAVRTFQNAEWMHGGATLDGIFGPATLAKANGSEPKILLAEFVTDRLDFYANIQKLQFDHSWFGRTVRALLL
jgi:lysozyme family protein